MCRSYHHIQGQCCLGVQPDSASSEDSSGDCMTGLSLTLQPKRSLNKSASREPPVQFSLVQLLSCVQLFATPWTAACQASLSITNSHSLLKLISIELVMPSNHLILCHHLLLLPSVFPGIRIFSNEATFASGGQSIGVSASTSVLSMNTQDCSPFGWTGWISLQSKGLSRVFSTPQFKSINSSVLSFLYSPTLTSIP